MRLKIIFILAVFLFTFSVQTAFAVDVQLSGKILDRNNNPMIGAQLQVKDRDSQKVVGSAESDFSGAYTVFVPDGTYDITVIGKTAKGEETKTFSNQKISESKTQDFKLSAETNAPIPPQPYDFSNLIIGGLVLLLIGLGVVILIIKKKK